MPILVFGKKGHQLIFANDSEFYEAYGFLCNNTKHHTELCWEYNKDSGAWENEGRIHLNQLTGSNQSYSPIPTPLQNKLTNGRWGNPVYRINCNDYIKYLVHNFGFVPNPYKPGNQATRSAQFLIPPTNPQQYVPNQNIVDFNRGFNM